VVTQVGIKTSAACPHPGPGLGVGYPVGIRLKVYASDCNFRVLRVEDSPCEVDASLMVIAMLLQVGHILGEGVSAFGPSVKVKARSCVFESDRGGPRLKVRQVVFGPERLAHLVTDHLANVEVIGAGLCVWKCLAPGGYGRWT
jgi:hypothetical protein